MFLSEVPHSSEKKDYHPQIQADGTQLKKKSDKN